MPADATMSSSEHTMVFVGGLHRSGTSLLFQMLRDHPEISGFRDTGVREDEGQHLQHTYKPANAYGGSGNFAFADEAHLVEVDADRAARDREALLGAWSPYWDMTRRVLAEKSPPNLIRMRYLQSVFPGAAFVVILRNPVTTALATKKWRRRQSLRSLIRHWFVAHDIALADAVHVERVLLLRYEDLVADPTATLARVQALLELATPLDAGALDTTASDRYTSRWTAIRANRFTRLWASALERRFGDEAARYGYRLDDLGARAPWNGVVM